MGLTFESQRKPAGAAARPRSLVARPVVTPHATGSALTSTAHRDPSPLDHSFGDMAVHGAHGSNATADASNLAISSSGDPTVTIKYAPEAGDKSTKIVFIQVVQTMLDGTAVKPGTVTPKFSHLDADTTGDFYAVDHVAGEADPYYNGDDAGKDGGTQGNATAATPVTADMTDTPGLSDGDYPAGKTTFKAQFRTIAFSAAGADKGKFYSYAKWSFSREKGKTGAIAHEGTSTSTALPQSHAAIDLWCTNHGFVLPK